MVETHLAGEDYQKVVQSFSTRGLQVLGAEAAISPKQGTNQGFMIVFSANQHVYVLHKQIIDVCGWMAVQWSFQEFQLINHDFCLHEVWGSTTGSNPFASGLIQQPTTIMGDFKVTWEELMTTMMGSVTQMTILATGEETCNTGNELDCALVSNMVADFSVQVNWEVPFKPHEQLLLRLDQDVEYMSRSQ